MDPIDKLREEAKAIKQEVYDSWIADTYLFNIECLGVEKGKDKVPLSKFHKEMCEFVDHEPARQKLLLVPRGHLKSTLITIGKTIQWICEDPTVRILIANATYQMAIAFLNVIKRHLTNNSEIIDMFGPLALEPDKWAENMITLNQSKVVGGEKEATVFCYGMGGNLVSQHYDKIILDDVVNEGTVNTKEQIEKTIQFYRLCQPLLEKDGELIIIGTRWREDDLYGWIMDSENGAKQDFNIYENVAIKDGLWDNGKHKFVKGTTLWPEKYDLKGLSEIRRKMGPWTFSAQYMNNPVPPEDADFKREWFRYYEIADIRGLEMNKYTLIDPAISLDTRADYTAMMTIGVDQYSNLYVLDIVRDRLSVSGIINAIFQQNERWHPRVIGLEEVAFQRALRYAIQQESQKRKMFLNIVELKPRARSKIERIKGLQPLYANGKVLHFRELIYNIYLEDELLRFPKGKHDDMIDALSYCLDLIHPAVKKVTRQSKHKYLYA